MLIWKRGIVSGAIKICAFVAILFYRSGAKEEEIFCG